MLISICVFQMEVQMLILQPSIARFNLFSGTLDPFWSPGSKMGRPVFLNIFHENFVPGFLYTLKGRFLYMVFDILDFCTFSEQNVGQCTKYFDRHTSWPTKSRRPRFITTSSYAIIKRSQSFISFMLKIIVIRQRRNAFSFKNEMLVF